MISIIAAIAENNVLGGDNRLLWHISEDLRFFKKVTMGSPVIMGRKTYDSIGKPLPGRLNIVITSDPNYNKDGIETANSLEIAIASAEKNGSKEIFIIGGGSVYDQSINIADRLYITKIYNKYDGDTFFPDIDDAVWKKTWSDYHEHGEKFDKPFEFIIYERI